MQQLEFNLGTHFLSDVADIKGSHQGLYPDPFRLKRVWEKLSQRPFHYSAPNSHIKLGIGQAQLASTVYWLVVLKSAQYQHNHLIPTERGWWFFQKFDPYFEYPETPWLLHYWGLEPPCLMPSWSAPRTKVTGLRASTSVS